jgi:hypothetical protein
MGESILCWHFLTIAEGRRKLLSINQTEFNDIPVAYIAYSVRITLFTGITRFKHFNLIEYPSYGARTTVRM